jgi:hypothetical protein
MQSAMKDPSAVLEFTLGESIADAKPGADGVVAEVVRPTTTFGVEFSKAELQTLLEKLDRVQSQLDSLSSR